MPAPGDTALLRRIAPAEPGLNLQDEAAIAAELGGKAVGILRIGALALPVPDAWCLSVRADQLWRQSDDRGELPAEVRSALTQARRALGDAPLAVRSSATVEDAAARSQAGRFVSVLDVRGQAALEAAVLRCYEQAADEADDPDEGLHMAVVIQRFVPARSAGVLFTAEPTGHGAPVYLVEAVHGLGTSLVDGSATPDRFRLDPERFEVRGQRRAQVRARLTRSATLSRRQLKALWQAARSIDAGVSFPADVEWCFKGNELQLLQLRPITTLARVGAAEAAADRGDAAGNRYQGLGRELTGVWSRKPSDEMWHGAVTPLMFDTAGVAIERAMVQGPLEHIGIDAGLHHLGLYRGRVYFSLAGMRAILDLLPSWAMGSDLTEAFPEEEREAIATGRPVGRPASLVWRISRVMAARLSWSPPASLDAFERAAAEVPVGSWPTPAREPQALLAQCDDVQQRLEAFLAVAVWGVAWAFILPAVATWGGRGGGRWALGEGGSNFTTRGNQELLRLAELWRACRRAGTDAAAHEEVRQGRSPRAAGEEMAEAFDAFLARYGHRTTERDVLFPRLHEVPVQVLDLVDGLSRQFGGRGPRPQPRRQDPPPGPLSRYARRFVDLRENMRYYADSFLDRIRQLYLQAGALLVEAGALASAEDVFFLTREEVRRGLGGERLVTAAAAARRGQYERFLGLDAPEIIRDGVPASSVGSTRDGRTLVGSGASGGTARGPVRVVRTATDLSGVQAGDVVVARALDPSWTAVLTVASAVVTEVGGILSHAAIVAREYGVPAVVGVERACDLAEGTAVEVDGFSGAVRVLETAHPVRDASRDRALP